MREKWEGKGGGHTDSGNRERGGGHGGVSFWFSLRRKEINKQLFSSLHFLFLPLPLLHEGNKQERQQEGPSRLLCLGDEKIRINIIF